MNEENEHLAEIVELKPRGIEAFLLREFSSPAFLEYWNAREQSRADEPKPIVFRPLYSQDLCEEASRHPVPAALWMHGFPDQS